MTERSRRPALSAARVVASAMALADAQGLEALTIRRLADSLGAGPMSLYHYVASRDDLVDAMVEQVFAEIAVPDPDLDWRTAVRARCESMRTTLRRHPWAAPLMESRTSPGPQSLAHHEAVLATLRRGGLSWSLTAHAYAVLDAFVYGFAFEESALPFEDGADLTGLADQIMAGFPEGAYPTFAAFTREHVLRPGYSYGSSFGYGLDLILDGLQAALEREQG